eukprot:1159145-Pelagomonas_calceolata.AAC.22
MQERTCVRRDRLNPRSVQSSYMTTTMPPPAPAAPALLLPPKYRGDTATAEGLCWRCSTPAMKLLMPQPLSRSSKG